MTAVLGCLSFHKIGLFEQALGYIIAEAISDAFYQSALIRIVSKDVASLFP